jgi:hypothetical protein
MVEPLTVVGYDGGANGGSLEVRGGASAIFGHDVLGQARIRCQDVIAEI